jgi:hypothetical protein
VATSSVSPPDPEQDVQDAELPDPSRVAIRWAAAFLAAAVALALLADLSNLDKDPAFNPKSVPGGGVAIFAGFLAASAVIERMLELAGPFIPWWDHPARRPVASGAGRQAAIAQKKADRGYALVTVAASLGVLASAATGLYLADAIGLSISRWADILFTGLAVGAGANGLHEIAKSLQKAKGSGTPAG